MSSHEASTQPINDDLDEDPVISRIRKTGCLEKHFDVLVSNHFLSLKIPNAFILLFDWYNLGMYC